MPSGAWISGFRVDGKPVFDTTLAGSAKRFGVFGKRAEKGFTRSLNLSPGVRVVSVRLRSTADKFDQTRVERFDLDPASVAGMRIAADKSGLSVVAERPPAPERTPAPPIAQAPLVAQATQVAPAPQTSALDELYQDAACGTRLRWRESSPRQRPVSSSRSFSDPGKG